jgi:diguanylate cyclase (GGDEF)-like protein
MDVNNYVYYGGADGRFVGVFRITHDFVELYWHEPGAALRQVYSVSAPGDREHVLRTDEYDPRKRPWYRAAANAEQPVWSPIYNDYTSAEPTITLAKPVRRPDRGLLGVAATDVTLKVLSDFMRTLDISKSGVAYIVDADGYIVASSGQEVPVKRVHGVPVRMRAEEMRTALISESYRKSYEWQRQVLQKAAVVPTRQLELSVGSVDLAVAPLGNKQGLNWLTVVAVPRSDFMSSINNGFMQSVAIAIACTAIALALGLGVVEKVVRDIRKLTSAAEKFGNGEALPELDIRRDDELGGLAHSLVEMESKLRFDRLTKVANREALLAQVHYLQDQARRNGRSGDMFTLLFVELEGGKEIAAQYGRDAADQVLVTVAQRLQGAVRESDMVARYGSEEFALLLKETRGSMDMAAVRDKIFTLLQEPLMLEQGAIRIGAAIGWASYPEDGDDYVQLLKAADARMTQGRRERKPVQMHLVTGSGPDKGRV